MINIEKLAVPISLGAAVIGIYVYLKGTNSNPITGNIPNPATVPTFSAVPYAPYNYATPSSNAGGPSALLYPPATGLATTSSPASVSTVAAIQNNCVGFGHQSESKLASGLSWGQTINQGTMLD